MLNWRSGAEFDDQGAEQTDRRAATSENRRPPARQIGRPQVRAGSTSKADRRKARAVISTEAFVPPRPQNSSKWNHRRAARRNRRASGSSTTSATGFGQRPRAPPDRASGHAAENRGGAPALPSATDRGEMALAHTLQVRTSSMMRVRPVRASARSAAEPPLSFGRGLSQKIVRGVRLFWRAAKQRQADGVERELPRMSPDRDIRGYGLRLTQLASIVLMCRTHSTR